MLLRSRIAWVFGLLLVCAQVRAFNQAQVDHLLKRVLATAKDNAIRSNRISVKFTRTSISEELSDKGVPSSKKVRTYRVYPLLGAPYQRLIHENDKKVPVADQEKKEAEVKKERAEGEITPNRKRDFQLTPEILARYKFTFDSVETFNDRKVVVLNFKPKSPAVPFNNIYERILNCLGGTIRVDSEDAEVVSADIKLVEKVALWGGIVGNLEMLQLHVTRKRILPGVWLNEQTVAEVSGRKLLSGMRIRYFETCKDFEAPR